MMTESGERADSPILLVALTYEVQRRWVGIRGLSNRCAEKVAGRADEHGTALDAEPCGPIRIKRYGPCLLETGWQWRRSWVITLTWKAYGVFGTRFSVVLMLSVRCTFSVMFVLHNESDEDGWPSKREQFDHKV